MLLKISKNPRSLLQKPLIFLQKNPIFSHQCNHPPPYTLIQIQNYVDVYMKWKKDVYFDSIESVNRSIHLKPIIALKNFIVSASPQHYAIPISAVSKKALNFGIPNKVASFLRQNPSFFEEFTGPQHNLPWFKLTQKAIELDSEERKVYQEFKFDLINRLRRFALMSCGVQKVLPLKIIQGMQWYLGLPDEFLSEPEKNLHGFFRVVEMEDGLKGLAVTDGDDEKVLTFMQRNAMRRGLYSGELMEGIAFPLFPSKGVRLRRKIADWLDEFQNLRYISPYEDTSNLNPASDLADKRVVALLHELLCLFVEHSAERKKLLCLRKYLGLPQKVHKAFERHPHIFYLSLKNKTCTVILKEAYRDKYAIDEHPLAGVRKKYISLMKESEVILRSRRFSRSSDHNGNVNVKDLDCTDDESSELVESSV